jgi:hypothetical protein
MNNCPQAGEIPANLSKETLRRLSIAARRLFTDLSPQPFLDRSVFVEVVFVCSFGKALSESLSNDI